MLLIKRVDRDRGLTGLAVADDQLALATADRHHRVDRLDAGLHRLRHRLAEDHARSLELGRAGLGGVDLTLAVERTAERVDDAAAAGPSPTGTWKKLAGALDGVAFFDLVPVAEQHGADVVGFEVQREADDAVRQLEHFERHHVVEAVDARDAVGHRKHGSDLGEVSLAGFEAFDPALQNACDFVWLDLHLKTPR